MSNAWETTIDDVQNVLRSKGLRLSKASVIVLYEDMDHYAIAKMAMYGSDIDQQTDYAYAEIARQLGQSLKSKGCPGHEGDLIPFAAYRKCRKCGSRVKGPVG